jgi:hypothetical protein
MARELGYGTRLGGFHARPFYTGHESGWHQRLCNVRTRIPTRKEAFAKLFGIGIFAAFGNTLGDKD